MPLLPIGKSSMFLGCPSAAFMRSFVRLFVCTEFLPQYLMNSLRNLYETYMEYSLAPTDDLLGFWRSKVKVIDGH